MAKRKIHVVPRGSEWAVQREGATKPSKITDTKRDALEIGRQQAKRAKTELVIHGKDGKIQDSDSYGPDPCPPKDKKH